MNYARDGVQNTHLNFIVVYTCFIKSTLNNVIALFWSFHSVRDEDFVSKVILEFEGNNDSNFLSSSIENTCYW